MSPSPLGHARIALPETRELDLFSAMLERLGATVVRCPLIRILDLEDASELDSWITAFVRDGLDLVVLYTGEGVSRMAAAAERLGLQEGFVARLAAARKLARGPKPVAALRKLGLAPDLVAAQPTTAGVLEALRGEPLQGRSVGVQLYPEADTTEIEALLQTAGASFHPVLPYRYAPCEADERVAAVIDQMAAGEIDLIAFTSGPQVRRLTEVAQRLGRAEALAAGLSRTRVAAVGPLTAQAVEAAGVAAVIQPAANFHLKPLVAEIVRTLGAP